MVAYFGRWATFSTSILEARNCMRFAEFTSAGLRFRQSSIPIRASRLEYAASSGSRSSRGIAGDYRQFRFAPVTGASRICGIDETALVCMDV